MQRVSFCTADKSEDDVAGEQLEGTRRALRDAIAQAERAAELARLLDAAQAKVAEAEHATADLREAEKRLHACERELQDARAGEDKLRRDLAEQRYQTEVARWKLSSMEVARWSRLGDALKTGKSNPVRLARGLRGAARSAKRPVAPKRQPVPSAAPEKQQAPGAAFQARSSVRTIEGASFKLKPFRVPTGPNTRPHLTVAAVVDPHAEALLRYEWRQTVGFTPRDFARVLPQETPHLLLVESVTEGPWAQEVTGEPGEGLRDLLAWCAERGIRTLFWHTSGEVADYQATAALFEHVVTASHEALHVWRSVHPRAGLLPLAVQPRVHNPIPLAGDRFDRILSLDELLPAHLSYPDVLTSYRWPKGVTCPPSTATWRLAEIAACGTPIGSLPDDRRAHAGVRNAYAGGTMTERVDDLLELIGLPAARATLNISVVIPMGGGDVDRMLAQVARQSGVGQVVLVAPEPEIAGKRARDLLAADVVARAADPGLSTGGMLDRALDLCEGDLVAVMDPRDVYGEHYLADLSRAFLFATADIVGKASYYAYLRDAGATVLRQPGADYSYLPEVAGGTLLARRGVLRGLGIADLSDGWDEVLMRQCRADKIKVFSADRFGYVRVRDEDADLLGSARLVGYGEAEPHAMA
ncbi:hypothetical protein [Streptosporangium sp. KLBMP 9127]|nr:hypothetical protein [Streptosporangium sp. KLBMP 9127]